MKSHKITRICWNSNNWTQPSGKDGKSKNMRSFENSTGFGFDEWLFDYSKIIDGYIYGYIPAARSNQILPPEKKFDLSFYSIKNEKSKKSRWWIGTIYNIELIDKKKSIEIYNIYKNNEWLKERFKQLTDLKVDYKDLIKDLPTTFFNIRYKINDIQLLDQPIEFKHSDPAVAANYYNFLNFTQIPNSLISNTSQQREIFTRSSYTVEERVFAKLHAILQNQLINDLKNHIPPHKKITAEHKLSNSTRIDILVKNNNNEHIMYEIKIAKNLRDVIRQSVGQLLEYAHIFGAKKIKQLIIVSIFDIQEPRHEEEREFLLFLNMQFPIPISYKYQPIDEKKLA